MFPRPTAEPLAARIKASRVDHMPWIELVAVITGSFQKPSTRLERMRIVPRETGGQSIAKKPGPPPGLS
jgi:hypothetical protein